MWASDFVLKGTKKKQKAKQKAKNNTKVKQDILSDKKVEHYYSNIKSKYYISLRRERGEKRERAKEAKEKE